MRRSVVMLVLVPALFAHALAGKAEGAAPKSVTRSIDTIVEQIGTNEGYPGLSVAIYLDGKPYYDKQTGYANVSAETRPDRNTIFRAYSLTKGVTQALAAVLAESGKLDLNAPISKYVPALPEHLQAITPRQLLEHQSGIRHYESDQEPVSRDREAIGFGGEGMGGRSALATYPSAALVVVIMANARGGELATYASEMAELVMDREHK